MKKAICKNNPKHKRFVTYAIVKQTWEVDNRGEFEDTWAYWDDVITPPTDHTDWECMECGSDIEFVD